MPATLQTAPSVVLNPRNRKHESYSEVRQRPAVQRGRTAQVLMTALPLLLSDLLAVAASLLTACAAIGLWTSSWQFDVGSVMLYLTTGLVVSNILLGLYPGTGLHPMVELRATILSVLLTNGLLLTALIAGGASTEAVVMLQLAVLSLLVLTPVCRSVTRKACAQLPGWGQAAFVLGDGESAVRTFETMQAHLDRGLRPVGILGDPMSFHRDMRGYGYIGPMCEAPAIARELSVHWAVIAATDMSADEISEVIDESTVGISNVVVTNSDGIPGLWSHAFSGIGLSGVYFQRGLLLPVPRIMKRMFDIAACLIGGIAILPLLLLIAAAIRITSPGPIIFRQRRIGQDGRYFMACKFRTMVMDADRVLEEKLNSNPEYRREWEADHKLKDDPRVTSIGRWLRKTSLDELPQIWNTLKGEMSLVGPRPIVDAEVAKYGRDFELYTSVPPGISGLWQVSGRNDTTYQQRVDLDSFYVRNWSPWMDIYILGKTVGVLVSRRGAY